MAQKIQRIRCISATEGILHLSAGWDKEKPLPLFFGEDNEPFANVTPLSKEDRMDLSGYAIFGETVRFMVSIDSFPMMFSSSTKLYLASSINGWAQAIGVTEWEMKRHDLSGREQFILDLPLDEIAEHGIFPFKFVTSEQQWLEVSEASPNRETIEPGRYNLLFDPQASENRLFRFIIPEGRSLAKRDFLTWREGEIQERWPLFYHGDLLELRSDAPMGCVPSEDQTTFRIFAPRANQVKLELSETPSTADYRTHMMIREPDGSWALDFETDLSSHFYRYYVDGINQDAGMAFCPETPILDPYAKAALCRDGPGIVISPERFTEPRERFKPPAMRDLVIVEAHLRDLLAKSPLPINETDRLGFNGLRQWALDNGNHLRSLGVNAIELQPLQEFDNVRPEEYHWGYMPVNYFAPASA